MTRGTEERRRREKLHSYRVSLDRLTRILYSEDPAGIASGVGFDDVAPFDEYELEASAMLPRLRRDMSVDEVNAVAREVVIRFFGTASAAPACKLDTIARRIHDEVLPGLARD